MATTHQPVLPRRGLRFLFLWPVILCWRFATLVVNMTGILLGLLLGLAMMTLGLFLCSTGLLFIFGAPLVVLGFLLLLRALY